MAARKAENLTTQVSARVPIELADYLQKLADEQERSLSWIVGKALQEWVKGKQEQRK